MGFLVGLLVLLLAETGTSQSNGRFNYTYIPKRFACGRNAPPSPSAFLKNRNSTLDELRMQLFRNNVLYARAQDLSDGDPVYGVAQCWSYLSVDQCLACFDAGASKLVNCPIGTNANVVLDHCFIRYEDFNDFYNDPYVTEDPVGIVWSECGNMSASQYQLPTYNQLVDGFLSEIRDVTPKTPNLYVASTRQITSENATMYVVAQCIENVNQTFCKTCMDKAYANLKNCIPSTEGTFFDMGCFARYSETPFFSDNQTMDISNFLKGHSSKVSRIAGVIGGVFLLFLVLIFWLLYRLWKKTKKIKQEDVKGAVNYNYKDLQLATNDFSEENILGKGGFGEVYKAILDDKSVVAVKRLHLEHATKSTEFENEVKLISNVHHRNLLRLLGWSTEGSDLLLVLEYMPNGSLDRFLWGAKRGTLDWTQRYEIIFGIARGLAHLHNEFHIKIIHRDIKSSNILLSDDFKPKIADFGLARSHPEDQSHVSTKFAGTLGYTAPEYARFGILSDKVDTYSFGIVILEIIGGRRCTGVKNDQPSTDYLLEHAWKLYENKMHIQLIDETLDLNQYEKQRVIEIIEIALLCTQSPVSNRPTMTEVVLMLQEGHSLGKRQLKRPKHVNADRRIRTG